MAENNWWEPSAEQCDSLERDISRLTGVPYNLGQTMIVAILRRQHAREKGLLDELHRRQALCWVEETNRVLRAHAALDAAPEPTLADAVAQIERECPGRVIATLKDSQAWTIIKLASERAEKERAK